MITKIQREFLGLLRQFSHPDMVWECSVQGEESWLGLLKLAQMHHTLPMVYDSVSHCQGFDGCPKLVKKKWKQQAVAHMALQTMRTQAFLELYPEMEKKGIHPVVIKGIVCRSLYSKPDLRISSDEDLLIPAKEARICDAFLLERGFSRLDEEEPDLEPFGETGYYNAQNQLYLEIHKELMPAQEKAYLRFREVFWDVFSKTKQVKVEGTRLVTLDDTTHFLYLLCHFYKHFVGSGVGVRQLCDILQLAEHGRSIDWRKLELQTKKLGIYRFWMNLFDIGERYLGFSWDKSGCGKPIRLKMDSEALLEDILAGGVYGKSSLERIYSAHVTLDAAGAQEGKDRGHGPMRRALFPPFSYMRREYPYLKRWGFLLPAAWIQRVVRYWRRMGHAGVGRTESIWVGRQRTALLKQYGLVDCGELSRTDARAKGHGKGRGTQ